MATDDIYARPRGKVPPFEFNEQVARVFDDMLCRSVPLYTQMIHGQVQLAAHFFQPGTLIYDLGCSNGNLGLALVEEMGERPFAMIAADTSQPMLDIYRNRLSGSAGADRITLTCRDIREVGLEPASVVVINLTLQFLPLADRDDLIARIGGALVPGGVLLLAEKVIHEQPELAEVQRHFHHRFKKENGYSDLEISQKRDALENVLVPETMEAHLLRLKRAGLAQIDIWLKWFNFAALLARKGA